MATLQGFRIEANDHVRTVVHGNFPGTIGKLAYRESPSSFSDEVVGPSRGTLIASNSDTDLLTVFPSHFDAFPASANFFAGQDMISSIQPGQKIYQLRVWTVAIDEGADSNVRLTTAGVEIQVHRKLLFPDEEAHYVRDEMLDNQFGLLFPNSWRDLSSVHSLLEVPSIDSAPVKVDNIVSYTVELQVSITPQ